MNIEAAIEIFHKADHSGRVHQVETVQYSQADLKDPTTIRNIPAPCSVRSNGGPAVLALKMAGYFTAEELEATAFLMREMGK